MLEKEAFFDVLANIDASETDLAIYFLWYLLNNVAEGETISFSMIMDMFAESRLRGNVNASRLKENLRRDERSIVKSLTDIQIKRNFEKNADLMFGIVADTPHQPQAELLSQIFSKRAEYFQELSREINSSYEMRNFNSSAVIMRRMVESLIIEAYLRSGLADVIKHNGNFIMLDALIGKAVSGEHFELSRDVKSALPKIKELGDKASHSRTYILKKVDVDDVALQFRSAVHELVDLSPKT